LISLTAVRYELLRIAFSRKYFYFLLLLAYVTYQGVTGVLTHGANGTPPFSRLSYANFLTGITPYLVVLLVLLCAGVFSKSEIAARRIIFSTPITSAEYFGIKGTAIVSAFLIAAAVPIVASLVFIGWQFRCTRFHEYIHPILVFFAPSAVLTFGLAMAAGRISVKLVYALLPVLFMIGVINVDLPVWFDLCGNNFLLYFTKIVFRSLGSVEIKYFVPTDFIMSRFAYVVLGVALSFFACRKIRN
jgi:hypothetical protein